MATTVGQKKSNARKRGEFFFGTNRPYLLAVVAAIILFILVAPVRVHGDNMASQLDDGDVVVISKSTYYDEKLPEYGDIICFKHSFAPVSVDSGDAENERSYRFATVYGLPGDEMTVTSDALLRNGVKVCDLVVSESGASGSGIGSDTKTDTGGANPLITNRKVDSGEVFVLNYNTADVLDSRNSGIEAKLDDVRGKILFRIFPINMFGIVK